MRNLAKAILLSLIGCACGSSQFDVPDPGIRAGAALFDKQLLVRRQEIGEVTDIALGRVDGDEREYLVLAGTLGYALLDPKSGEFVRSVAFEVTMREVAVFAGIPCRALDADGDGSLEFAKVANWSQRMSLHGSDGKAIWAGPDGGSPFDEQGVQSSSVGDVDGDGKLEFLICVRTSSRTLDEVHLHDQAGKLIWSQQWSDGGPGHAEFVFHDVDGDGQADLVYVAGQELIARNAKGAVVVRTRIQDHGYLSGVWLIRSWGDPPADRFLIKAYAKNTVNPPQTDYLVGLDAKTVVGTVKWDDIEPRIDAVPVEFAGAPEFARAKLNNLEQPAFVGVSDTRLRVTMSDKSGVILYDEVLMPPDAAKERTRGAMLFRPAADGRPAQFLVAYGSCVWAYTARE